MPVSLQEELKQFEKELSLLLVRFMKICDQVDATKNAGAPEAPKAPSPPAAQAAPAVKKAETSFVAYA